MKSTLLEYILLSFLIICFGLFLFAGIFDYNDFWSLAILQYLPSFYLFLTAILIFFCLALLFNLMPVSIIENTVTSIYRFSFESIRNRLILIFFFMLAVYFFRLDTFLNGDGYAILANYGQGEQYIHKWSEFGSSYLIRYLQEMSGGYTKTTALTIFQMFSILSGFVYLIAIFQIAKLITGSSYNRLFIVVTFIGTPLILFFFGYIEYYPVTIALMALLVWMSLRRLQHGKSIIPVLVIYLLGLLWHIQFILFLPGLLFLFGAGKIDEKISRKIFYGLLVLFVGAVGGVVYLYLNYLQVEVLIIPLLHPRPEIPGYTLFSLVHFRDLTNLLLFIFPAVFVILIMVLMSFRECRYSNMKAFFLLNSLSSLAFLFLFAASTTVGRDWDILSVCLIFPIFFLLTLIREELLSAKIILTYLVFVLTVTGLYLFVNLDRNSQAERYNDLLTPYNRNMWISYAEFTKNNGDDNKYSELMHTVDSLYPQYVTLRHAYHFLGQGERDSAFTLAKQLVQYNPNNSDFLQLEAFFHVKEIEPDSAETLYLRALTLNPYSYSIINELGMLELQRYNFDSAEHLMKRARELSADDAYVIESMALLYRSKQEYDKSYLLADSLLMKDSTSSSAFLINLMTAVEENDYEKASQNFNLFLQYGRNRPDFRQKVEYYRQFFE